MSNKLALNLLPFTKNLTGTGNYTKRLIAELQKIDHENDYQLHVYNLDDAQHIFDITAVNFKIIKHHFIRNKIGRIFYEQLILPFRINADIFISPSVVLPLLLPSRIKKISVIHDLIPFIFKKKYDRIQGEYVKLFTKLSAKKADIVITISENSKKDIKEILSVDESKIRIIYNFIPHVAKTDVPVTAEINGEFLITVSTIQPGKNLIRLFEAFKPIALERNIKLVVIGGKGWKYDDIFEKVTELGLKDYIVFTGYVSDEALTWYYKHSVGLVYVSLYEGFGIPPLEAISNGCSVVVSNVSSLPEVVGEAGIYIDPLDVNSIRNGIMALFNPEITEDKKRFMSAEAAKFDGRKEAIKFLDIISEFK